MHEFTLTETDDSRNIDLGKSRVLTVANLFGDSVQVFIDYRLPNGNYSSAVKGSATYASPQESL